jgi:hypothetical protein
MRRGRGRDRGAVAAARAECREAQCNGELKLLVGEEREGQALLGGERCLVERGLSADACHVGAAGGELVESVAEGH